MDGGIVLVPWYQPADYYRFRNMNGGRGMPASYNDWLGIAVQEVTRLLARGTAVQIVRLKPDDYFRWLAERCAADTPSERLAYLAAMHGEAGCAPSSDFLLPNWPQTPTAH